MIHGEHFLVIPSVIKEHECNNILERGTALDLQPAETWSGRTDHRRGDIAWFNRVDNYDITNMIMECAQIFCRNKLYYDINYINDIQFTKYAAGNDGGDHYGWHHDLQFFNERPFDRKISFVLQLSHKEEYEGGEFQFQDPYENVPPEAFNKGSVIMFPSFVPHRVTPVTEGTRYSLVSWVEGPRFK